MKLISIIGNEDSRAFDGAFKQLSKRHFGSRVEAPDKPEQEVGRRRLHRKTGRPIPVGVHGIGLEIQVWDPAWYGSHLTRTVFVHYNS